MLRIPNWDRYQHYKKEPDHRPAWIKLYAHLHDDYDFVRLPDAVKAHVVGLWILAARLGNQIPDDPAFIMARCGFTEPVNIEFLVEKHWVERFSREGLEEVYSKSREGLEPLHTNSSPRALAREEKRRKEQNRRAHEDVRNDTASRPPIPRDGVDAFCERFGFGPPPPPAAGPETNATVAAIADRLRANNPMPVSLEHDEAVARLKAQRQLEAMTEDDDG